MSEANAIALALDDLRLDGRLEHVAVAAGRSGDERRRRLGEGRGGAERSAGLGRQRGEPPTRELVHVIGHRQALAGVERSSVQLERAGELEGEEGVSPGGLVDST
jgi:hypothetical protein